MIQKCDHLGCQKAGTCRAPKSRDLKEYWYFCPEHAAEYNRNWNYYADMTPDEIEADWERQVFGTSEKDRKRANRDAADYVDFLNDFITGRGTFDKMPAKKSLPGPVANAFRTLDLPITSTLRDVSAAYRKLAKLHHPDTSKKDATAFTKISAAYTTLKKYFA
jgi:hypothetical protein